MGQGRDSHDLALRASDRYRDVKSAVKRGLFNPGAPKDIKLPYEGTLMWLKFDKDFDVWIYEIKGQRVTIYDERIRKYPANVPTVCQSLDRTIPKLGRLKRLVKSVWISNEHMPYEVLKRNGIPAKVSKAGVKLGSNITLTSTNIDEGIYMHAICGLCDQAVELKDWNNVADCMTANRTSLTFDQLYNKVRSGEGEETVDRLLGRAKNEYYKQIMLGITKTQDEKTAWTTLAKYTNEIENCANGVAITFARKGKGYFIDGEKHFLHDSDHYLILDKMYRADLNIQYKEPAVTKQALEDLFSGAEEKSAPKPNDAPHMRNNGFTACQVYSPQSLGIIPPQPGDQFDPLG